MDKKIVKAEIIGLLCAEGCHRDYYIDYREFDNRRGKYYSRKRKHCKIIEFSNKHLQLLHHFRKLLRAAYSYDTCLSGGFKGVKKVTIGKHLIIDDLVKHTAFGVLKWRVPSSVLKGRRQVKAAFIRGYFDGDGSISFVKRSGYPILTLTSSNRTGLKQVSSLLSEFKILHATYGPYKRKGRLPVYKIFVAGPKRIKEFYCAVGSAHSVKRTKLLHAIKYVGD